MPNGSTETDAWKLIAVPACRHRADANQYPQQLPPLQRTHGTDRKQNRLHRRAVQGRGPSRRQAQHHVDRAAARSQGQSRRQTVAHLKLGPLPKHNTVRVPLVLSEPFKEELDAYAIEHSKQHGEPVPETAELIIHILETFLRFDPGWRSHRKQRGKSKSVNGKPARSAPQTSTTDCATPDRLCY
jgi:hypothetical protein